MKGTNSATGAERERVQKDYVLCANFELLFGGLKLYITIEFLFCTTGRCLWHHCISTWGLPMHSLKSQPDKTADGVLIPRIFS